jgi:uncharacterized protein YggU (UPF0235/DUF167 family)
MFQKVLVKPNKKANQVYWKQASLFAENENILIVETTESPIEGRANKKVIELVAEFLNLKKSQVSIKTGKTDKIKLLIINSK